MVATPPDAPDGIAPRSPEDFDANLQPLQDQWRSALDDLLSRWPDLQAPWEEDLLGQLQHAVLSGDMHALAGILPDLDPVPGEIEDALYDLARQAGEHTRSQAADQDIELPSASLGRAWLAGVATVSAATLGAGLAMSTIREGMRAWGRGSTATRVADQVRIRLDELTTAQPEYVLGGAMTAAQHYGRMLTARGGPGAALYADEILDNRTCKYCRAVHRRWLGNLEDPSEPWTLTYPVRGYVDCLGHDRCRGQIVYVWRGGTDWTKWVEKEPLR